MDLNNQVAVVTGGSRGLGLGVVEQLVESGVRVTVVARGRDALEAVERRLGVGIIAADATDADSARRILQQIRPFLLILNAGAPPSMALLEDQDWQSFSNTWETDVKAALHWIQAVLALPLAPGSRVLVTSSGAAVAGSPMSGGYAGAKRMLWLMSNYANARSMERRLDVTFQAVLPRQIVGGTGIGDAAAAAYSRKLGVSIEDYLEGFGAPLPPQLFGQHVVSILTDPQYEQARAFGIRGDSGISVLEGAAS